MLIPRHDKRCGFTAEIEPKLALPLSRRVDPDHLVGGWSRFADGENAETRLSIRATEISGRRFLPHQELVYRLSGNG